MEIVSKLEVFEGKQTSEANGLNPLCAETVIKWQSEKVILGGGDNMPKIGG